MAKLHFYKIIFCCIFIATINLTCKNYKENEKQKVNNAALIKAMCDTLKYEMKDSVYFIQVKICKSKNNCMSYKIYQNVINGSEWRDNFNIKGIACKKDTIYLDDQMERIVKITEIKDGIKLIIHDNTTRRYFTLKSQTIPYVKQ